MISKAAVVALDAGSANTYLQSHHIYESQDFSLKTSWLDVDYCCLNVLTMLATIKWVVNNICWILLKRDTVLYASFKFVLNLIDIICLTACSLTLHLAEENHTLRDAHLTTSSEKNMGKQQKKTAIHMLLQFCSFLTLLRLLSLLYAVESSITSKYIVCYPWLIDILHQ